MSYVIEVIVEPKKGEQGISTVKSALTSLDQKAKETVGLMDRVFDGIAAEAKESAAAVSALSAQMDREAKILKAINGPMDEYIADVRALNALWEKGAINAAQYNAQLAKADKSIGIGAPAAKRGVIGRGIDALGPLAPAAGVVGAVVVAKGVGELSDAYTTLQNRLGTVNSATATTAELSDRLFNIAQTTRSEWTAVSEVFVRTSNALDGLGYSTEQTFQFTETLSKAVKISGASATEANAAMIQLSQGLSSGTLRGDELRSVLEQLPTVADVIAKGLGVTRGELRKLGEDGKISTASIIDAFAKAKTDIDGKFGKTLPTLSEQFIKLKNVVIKAVGDAAPVLGKLIDIAGIAISAIGKVLSVAADISGAVGKIAAAGSAIDTSKIKYGDFGKVLGEVKSRYASLNLETVDAGIAVDGTYERVFRFTGQLQAMADKLEALKPTVNGIKTAMQGMQTATALAFAEFAKANAGEAVRIIKLKGELDKLLDAADPAGAALRQFGEDAETMGQSVAAGLVGVFEAGRALAFIGAQAKDKLGKDAADAAKKGADAFAALMDRVRGYRDEVDKVGAAERALLEVERDLDAAVRRRKITEEEAIDIYERKAFAMRDQLDPMEAYLDGIRRETELLKMGSEEREQAIAWEGYLNTLRQAGLDITLERIAAFQIEAEALRQARADSEAREAGAGELGKFATDVFKRVDEGVDATAALKAKEAARDAKVEAKEAAAEFGQSFDGIYRQATDVASATASAWTNAFSSMEDAIITFRRTGEFNFQAFADSIIDDLLRIAIRQAAVGIFGRPGDATGAGGAGGLLSGLLGFATGGSFTVGGHGGTDTTPVMFRATPGERVIVQTPAQQAAAAAPAYAPAPIIHNNMVLDSRQFLQVLQSPGGRRELHEAVRVNAASLKALLR